MGFVRHSPLDLMLKMLAAQMHGMGSAASITHAALAEQRSVAFSLEKTLDGS